MASTSTTTILKKIRIQDVIEKMRSYLGCGSSGGSGGGGGGGSGDVQIDVKNKIQTVPLSWLCMCILVLQCAHTHVWNCRDKNHVFV